MTKLRCHLLIGPPASGKTTFSQSLAPLLNAKIISTDLIRKELWGDELHQGPWEKVEEKLHSQLKKYVSEGKSVLIDATHAKRSWRLALTQGIIYERQIEWIGWWLETPREICLKWNKKRERTIEEKVISQYYEDINDERFGPCRAEGFSSILKYDPSKSKPTKKDFTDLINELKSNTAQGKRQDQLKELHGYSRLIDFERLLYLIQLLSKYPGLTASDKPTIKELELKFGKVPTGSMDDRASYLLSSLHQCNCYSDKNALKADLKWLEAQGFLNASTSQIPIEPPKPNELLKSNLGGWPQEGEREVFIRVMTLLRYALQNPFDHKKIKGRKMEDYYISQLNNVYTVMDRDKFRGDIVRLLTPYKLRNPNGNTRHGYGLGTAVLSAQRLKELGQLLAQTIKRLGDPTAQALYEELQERLKWASINTNEPSVRIFANRSIVNTSLVNSDSLANPEKAQQLELAITNNQRILLERFSTSGGANDTRDEEINYVWPLQLIFHNIGWYLAVEDGRSKSLIRTMRLDRLALRDVDTITKRDIKDKEKAIKRLNRLMEISGGIYFGNDVEMQYDFTELQSPELEKKMTTLRFRSTEEIYKYLREGLQRYPMNQLRLSKQMKGDKWKQPKKGRPFVLDPQKDHTHPYPMEIDLPPWTIEKDIDFRRWLFGFGEKIIIEEPKELVNEYLQRNKNIRNLYQK